MQKRYKESQGAPTGSKPKPSMRGPREFNRKIKKQKRKWNSAQDSCSFADLLGSSSSTNKNSTGGKTASGKRESVSTKTKIE